jgi:hypothetical protein
VQARHPGIGELRRFGLATGLALAFLLGLALPLLLARPLPWWPWLMGAVLVSWGLAHPASLGPVHRGWMRCGAGMSRVTTPILLGTVFFLVVLPTGLLRRLVGRDSLARRFDAEALSYRVASRPGSTRDLEKPY